MSLTTVDKDYAKALAAHAAASAPEGRKAARNTFIEERLGLIDSNYAAWERSIYQERVGTNVGVDIATLSMTAIAAAVPGVDAKTWLAAISAGVIGSKASIDKNVYFERTMPALLAQMDANRVTVRIRLLSGMQADTSVYPLSEANADLWTYFRAGTLARAIEGITTQAGFAQKAAEVAMENRPSLEAITKRLKERGFAVAQAETSAEGDELFACVKADARNAVVLTDWLKQQAFPSVDDPLALSLFFKAAEHAQLRKAAVKDNALLAQLKGCSFAASPK